MKLLEEIRPELKGYFIQKDKDSGQTVIITPLEKEYDCGYKFYWD
jgi:hypothetical protein